MIQIWQVNTVMAMVVPKMLAVVGRQLVVKHRGNTREIGSGESYLLINKLN